MAEVGFGTTWIRYQLIGSLWPVDARNKRRIWYWYSGCLKAFYYVPQAVDYCSLPHSRHLNDRLTFMVGTVCRPTSDFDQHVRRLRQQRPIPRAR